MNTITLGSAGQTVTPVGCGFSTYGAATKILPSWKRGYSNYIQRSANLGDATIGFPNGYEIHDDLIISCGWGDGAAVRRLNNDGTLTQIWGDATPLNTQSSGAYYQSIAIHKASKKFVISTHNGYGYAIYDYSPCFTDGAAIELEVGLNIFSTGVNIDRVGQAYDSGMVIAGDWLYVGDYDATHYRQFPRRNMVTSAEELLDGTLIIDRADGYRYKLNYDEVNDRVYYFPYYGSGFTVILNASAVTPTIIWVDMGDAGLSRSMYDAGLFVVDPISTPNLIYVASGDNFVKLDISDCINQISTIPAVIGNSINTLNSSDGQYFPIYVRMGTKYQNTTSNGQPHDKMLSQPSTFIPLTSDRGQMMMDGWLDIENEKIVGMYRRDAIVEDTTTLGRGSSWISDYGSPVVAMYSANSTKYWIKFGYGSSGHAITTWADNIGNGLIGDWEITFGNYTSIDNIDVVILTGDNFTIPSGCSVAAYVSNDNGITWESYDFVTKDLHVFSSAGTTLKIKFIATGFEHKAPYYQSQSGISVLYGKIYQSEKTPQADLKEKITKLKRRGL